MSSPFASQSLSERIPLPWDAEQWCQVRKLTGRQIEQAQEAHRSALIGNSSRLWAATFRRALEKGATDPDVVQAIQDPLTGYDRFALVRSGLVAWSYPQSIKPIPAKAEVKGNKTTPASPAVEGYDAIEDLDDEAVDFYATEVLRITKPALFLTTEEDVETAQKELQAAAPMSE